MVSFFRRGNSGRVAAEDSVGHKRALSEYEVRMICVAATVGLMLLALLALALSGSGSAFDRCNGILLQSQKNSCFRALASGTGNATMCGMITAQAQRYSCLVGIAEAKGNITLCSEVNHTNIYYSQCVLNVSMSTGNESYCNLLGQAQQSSCTFNLAKASKFSSLASCDGISNTSMKKECTYLHYYGSALRSGSPANCSFLPNETNYTVMSLMLSSNLTGQSSGVQYSYASLNASPRDYCYYDLALLAGNSAGCSMVGGMLNSACTGAFVQSNATMNITDAAAFCALAKTAYGDLSDLCIGGILTSEATATMNISKCLQIPMVQYEYTCITNYAAKYANSSYCSYIVNSTVAQDCYITVTGKV